MRVLILGGFSLIFLVFLNIEFKLGVDWWVVAFYASFIVNSPHFLISYLFFYRGYKRSSELKLKKLLIGFMLPFALLAVATGSLVLQEPLLMVSLLFLMFILVGLHYVKQGFGIFLYEQARIKSYVSESIKKQLLIAMYLLWVGSVTVIWSVQPELKHYYGLEYLTLSVGTDWRAFGYTILGLSLLITIYALFNHRRNGCLSHSAVVALLIQYAWIAPIGLVPESAFVIPFFHSLQYMLIANEAVNRIDSSDAVRRFINWWGLSFVLGGIVFWFAPKGLEQLNLVEFQGQFFFLTFILVVNIHHYFIDSVIWTQKSKMVM